MLDICLQGPRLDNLKRRLTPSTARICNCLVSCITYCEQLMGLATLLSPCSGPSRTCKSTSLLAVLCQAAAAAVEGAHQRFKLHPLIPTGLFLAIATDRYQQGRCDGQWQCGY